MNALEDPYRDGRASQYNVHHQKSLRTRLTTLRERQLLKRAWHRADKPSSVLDLPCGTGRFWPVFEDTRVQKLTGADNSIEMLDIARRNVPARINTEVVHTSAFDTGFRDNEFPFTICMRFFHHLANPEDRLAALAELSRITSEYLVISLWTDGNLASWNRAKRSRPAVAGFGRRVCIPSKQIEKEFHDTGLHIVYSASVWPRLTMWRFYLLATGRHG